MNPETSLITRAIARVANAREKFNPIAVVALFSGGHDSATASIIANEAGADYTLHINTGIGVEQTREYVRDTCCEQGWNLQEYKAEENTHADGTPAPVLYDDLVRAHGFPGAFMHRKMYNRLKERQLRRFERAIGATSRRPVLYVSGCRSQESVRRMGNTEETQKLGRQCWVAPIHDFSKSECGRCLSHCGVKRNQVVDLIHKSGECLCGAFAEKGELDELRLWFPNVAKRIDDLQREVMERLPWGWEDNGPPDWFVQKQQGQTFMFDYDKTIQEQPLCRKCNLRFASKP